MESHIDQETGQQSISSLPLAIGSDHEALDNLFGSQRRRLLHIALRVLGNIEDAEDAVQEGLLAALRNLHRFEGRSQLSTWLTRIVVNAALMRLRTLHAHVLEPIDEPMMQPGNLRLSDVLVDGRPTPEEVCAHTEERRILQQGFQGLSHSHRRALSLHDFQGMTAKETAKALSLSEGTVKSQVHRARRKLSQQVRRIQEARALANLTGGESSARPLRTADRQKGKPSQADIGVNNSGAPENNDSDVTRTSVIDLRWERTRRDEERSQVKGVRGNQNRSRLIGYGRCSLHTD